MIQNLNDMSLEITNDLFVHRTENQYKRRHVNNFNITHIRSVYHGSESLSYLEQKVWDIIPERF